MQLALSTSACDAALAPAAALERWSALAAGELELLAIDERFAPEQQDALLRQARRCGVRCAELAHPLRSAGTRPAASPISADRDERRAAALQLVASVQRAVDADVWRVLLRPARLALTPDEAWLRGQLALGRELPLEELFAQRAARVTGCLDRLRGALDPALEAAARLGGQLALAGPPPWPHRVPRLAEARLLLDEFRGAPLSVTLCTDWAHTAACLGTAEDAALVAPAVRLADAAGLSTRLPLGTGELTATEAAQTLRQAALGVLAFGPDVEPAEVRRSVAWLAALPPAQRD